MLSGKLGNGFEYEVLDEALNDWEILEDINDMEEGDASKVINIAKKLLGPEQYQRFKEAHRGEDGRIPIDAMVDSVATILNSHSESKN